MTSNSLWPLVAQYGIAGLFGGVFAVLFNWIIDRYRKKDLTDIEALKAQLNRQSTQYSWLHENRASATSVLYSVLLDVEDALGALLPLAKTIWLMDEERLELFDADEDRLLRERIAQKFQKYKSAHEDFRQKYRPLRLLLPSEICTRLDELNSEYRKICEAYDDGFWSATSIDEYGEEEPCDFVDGPEALRLSETPKTKDLLVTLEDALRRQLYGSDALSSTQRHGSP